MPKIVVRETESIEDALRRFKRDVSRSGTLAEARKREFYIKPSVDRKLKRQAARSNKKISTFLCFFICKYEMHFHINMI